MPLSFLPALVLCFAVYAARAWTVTNSTDHSLETAGSFKETASAVDSGSISKTRRKRYISENDMIAILDYHNKVRGRVFPPAANMEYMLDCSLRNPRPPGVSKKRIQNISERLELREAVHPSRMK
ncbi:PI15 inhibitor, partial [Polypterus senegalus]|nr:PI15 inhibitor [Polypterus senegalus]